jgi:hypothetical protein
MNAQSITVTATVPAWLPSHRDLRDFIEAVDTGDNKGLVDMLSFVSFDMSQGHDPYTKVGEATVSIALGSRNDFTAGAIAALNTKLDTARAEFLQKQQDILAQISKLQAIEYVQEAK